MSFDGDSEIYTIRTDGGGRKQVTHNARKDSSPVYSPRGGQIAYVEDVDRTDGKDYEICRIKLRTGEKQRVTRNTNIKLYTEIDWGVRVPR